MKSILFLTLTIIFITCPRLSQAQRTKCDPSNRPNLENCTALTGLAGFAPVCGYYTKNCPFSVCARQKYSPCEACADPDINYHTPGDCKANQIVEVCTADICNKEMDFLNATLKDYFNPVCGIKKRCRNGSSNCEKTSENFCLSCEDKTYPFYQSGPCEHDKTYCESERPSECSGADSKQVCASFIDVYNMSHYVTASSGCNACRDPSVDFYLPGECGKSLNNQTYCLPNNRPKGCTKEYNPVCAFYNTSNGTYEHKVVSNPCTACSEEDVIYHTPGECIFYCDRNPMVIYDCAGILIPSCGTYQEDGVTKKVSVRNSCIGCYSLNIKIDTYTDRLCPGDDGILCANDAGAMAEGNLSPVCGLTDVDCDNNSCRKSFGDPFTACQNSSYVKYIPGLCPGDNGVSCDDYRIAPNENDYPFYYQNVCGYTSNNCDDDSCRLDYQDQFEACGNSDVLYFNAGPC